jgi:hypothetical protein
VSILVAISALKRLQSGTNDSGIGVRSSAHIVSSISLTGVSANLTEWLLGVIVVGVSRKCGHLIVVVVNLKALKGGGYILLYLSFLVK